MPVRAGNAATTGLGSHSGTLRVTTRQSLDVIVMTQYTSRGQNQLHFFWERTQAILSSNLCKFAFGHIRFVV